MGWEEGPDCEQEHPYQKKFDHAWDRAWENILLGTCDSVKRFIKEFQYKKLREYAQNADEFRWLADAAWGPVYELSEEEAEMLYLGEEKWLEENWPQDNIDDFD